MENSKLKRRPEWLRKSLPTHPDETIKNTLAQAGLNTVCRAAKCPNQAECYHSGTATFLVLGKNCTRACRFCAVEKNSPEKIDKTEPTRLSLAAKKMKLKYVVITMVTRDDLPLGGAEHIANCIKECRAQGISAIEVLTSDFNGDTNALKTVIDAQPSVFNHNVETIPRLYSEIRPEAIYTRSLEVLQNAYNLNATTKSGLMVGLGESVEEIFEVMKDLREVGVSLLTIGQYLAPSKQHAEVKEFVTPETFKIYEAKAVKLGFSAVAASPFTRSSHYAGELFSSTLL